MQTEERRTKSEERRVHDDVLFVFLAVFALLALEAKTEEYRTKTEV